MADEEFLRKLPADLAAIYDVSEARAIEFLLGGAELDVAKSAYVTDRLKGAGEPYESAFFAVLGLLGGEMIRTIAETTGDSFAEVLHYVADRAKVEDIKSDNRVCRVCGCTGPDACIVDGRPCQWVADDLCSRCFRAD